MTSVPNYNAIFEAYAEDAVDYAARFNTVLDYSVESLDAWDTIATQAYNEIPKNRLAKFFRSSPTEEQMHDMTKMFAAYAGEVFRKAVSDAHWGVCEDMQAVGIEHNNAWYFFPAKAYKHLTNGPEDSIGQFTKNILASAI